MCVSEPILRRIRAKSLELGGNFVSDKQFAGEELMTNTTKKWSAVVLAAVALTALGCSSLKTPATADVAVSKAAVENAAGAGGMEFAPVEMNAAREKMVRANKAMADKDYKLASQAQADAKLAQGKANSTKAQAASDALQDDIRVLREELDRNSK